MVKLRQIILVVLVLPFASAITGIYRTFKALNNKILPNPIFETKSYSQSDCQRICVQHALCEAYAISTFERTCKIYKMKLGSPTIANNGYQLYVRQKTEEEGFYVYELTYVKIILKYMNAFNAEKYCQKNNGWIVAVRDKKMEELLLKLMINHNVFKAFIGVNDLEKEMEWRYSDTSLVGYSNWDYKGKWERTDLNCAYKSIKGTWHHENCEYAHHFFCQYPMY